MQLTKHTVHIGLERPLKVLHVSDTHIAYADERDDERKRALAASRQISFGNKGDSDLNTFLDQIAYANEHCDLLVHTGDLCDFVSHLNLEKARAALDTAQNAFMIAGNHEFSQYVGEAWEDTAYKMTGYQQVRKGLGFDLLFRSQIVGGVNFVGVDNGYYNTEPWQLERLKMEAAKGLPIVLCMHTPIYEPALYEFTMQRLDDLCSYLMGCSEELLLPYSEYRAYQQRPTPDTMRFVDYVQSQPLIKAVLAGHLHVPFVSTLPGGAVQFVAGAGYNGEAAEITFE